MAFQQRNMSVLAYANGFTLWHYISTEETIEQMETESFFKPIQGIANTGDIVMLNGIDGTAVRTLVVSEQTVKLKKLK